MKNLIKEFINLDYSDPEVQEHVGIISPKLDNIDLKKESLLNYVRISDKALYNRYCFGIGKHRCLLIN